MAKENNETNKNDEQKKDNFSARDIRDHAWNYFELHANQRISLFRFYIIFFSLSTTAFIFLLARFPYPRDYHEIVSIIICVVFLLITIIFWLVDARIRNMIHFSEDALKSVERLFIIDYECSECGRANNLRVFCREEKESQNSCMRHTYFFRAIYIIAMLVSFAGIIGSTVSIFYF